MARPARRPPGIEGLTLLASDGFDDYRLIDSGNGRKLERFGRFTVDRPEPQALWQPRLAPDVWQRADATFSAEDDEEAGKWRQKGTVPDTWRMSLGEVVLLGRLSAFRHLGLFPEQLPHWDWMRSCLDKVRAAEPESRPRVLNLFAYTGAASLIAAAAGAEVTHVDASKKAVAWAKENQAASKLTEAPIRWMLDDARKFAAREVRRGKSYHVILVDPPKFGRGPGGEVWELFEHVPALIRDCVQLLAPQRSAIVVTAYAIRASALSIGQLLDDAIGDRAGRLDCGELAIREHQGHRAVPTSLYARWVSHDLGP
ncbi:MAG: class I SAM-dependent methyltransferase [Hyphomicrobiaceae bacterium]